MNKIIDNRGSGKTKKLMKLAKENNGVLFCSNPRAMKEKAHAYGLTGFDICSYGEYGTSSYDKNKPIFIDELEMFLKFCDTNIQGFTLSIED